MKKKLAALILLGLSWLCMTAHASGESALDEELIHQGLLGTMPLAYYPNSEFVAEGHDILGTQEKGDTLEIYLAASVGGYGFMGGGFTMQNGWSGPCTVVLERTADGDWALREVLEIEDYSEIPEIMPKAAQERFFAQRDSSIGEQIDAQVRAYLEGIGRTEPILSYAETGGELSCMFTHASNFRSFVDGDYPLGCTTIERLEADGRYLYTKAWTPDENGVDGYEYVRGETSNYSDGTMGTETLTRVRKADGKVMETTAIRVDLYAMTISLRDDYGSIKYTFPYDGWNYGQPTVTREGECRMDTARIEQKIAQLPVVQPRGLISCFAGAEPLYTALGADLLCPVHTAPDAQSPRAANGRAQVSFKDWVTILCREGDWLMVLYETNPGQYRTGWVDAAGDGRLMQLAQAATPAQFAPRGAGHTLRETALFDDPIHADGTVCTLPGGVPVAILCDDLSVFGEAEEQLYYVEVCLDGQTMRGFVRGSMIGR